MTLTVTCVEHWGRCAAVPAVSIFTQNTKKPRNIDITVKWNLQKGEKKINLSWYIYKTTIKKFWCSENTSQGLFCCCFFTLLNIFETHSVFDWGERRSHADTGRTESCLFLPEGRNCVSRCLWTQHDSLRSNTRWFSSSFSALDPDHLGASGGLLIKNAIKVSGFLWETSAAHNSSSTGGVGPLSVWPLRGSVWVKA